MASGRSVSLLDMDSKEIGKSTGYKLQELCDLKEGETLAIGGKEIEVCRHDSRSIGPLRHDSRSIGPRLFDNEYVSGYEGYK